MKNRKMKRFSKRSIAWILAIVMTVSYLPIRDAQKVKAAMSITAFISHPNWCNGASYSANQTPKSGAAAGSGKGCNAYVRDYIYQVYGGQLYNCGTRFSNVSEIRAGDVIYATAGTMGVEHWFVVTGRNGNSLNVAEGNYGGGVANVQNNRYTLSGNQIQVRFKGGLIKYHLFSFGYHFGSGSYTPSQPQSAAPSGSVTAVACEKYDHNMVPKAHYYNPNGARITTVGLIMKDGNNVVVKKEEQTGHPYARQGDIWFDVNKECGVTLRAGHVYSWQIYADIGGVRHYTNWINDRTTGSEKPNTPSFSTGKTHYAVGDAATISWGADQNATGGYSLTIKQISGGDYTKTLTTGTYNATSLAFSLPNAGEYKVTGFARGGQNSDTATLNKTIVAHNPSKVRFVELNKDGEENLLCEQTVRYGYSATAPTNVSREGHTFTGWKGEYNNVTSDRTITAQFKRNTYKIVFTDKDGKTIKTDSVLFEDSATAPEPPEPEKGYVFAGWDSEDYINVQGNATIKATYVWANDDLPVVITLNSCEFKEDGYILNYDIKNNPNKRTKGRALVSLKTSKGKLLDSTESKAFSLDKGEEKKGVEIYCPYEGVATKADLYIIDGFTKGIPISEVESVEIERKWSEWSGETPPEGKEIETRKEYRYKDFLSTTTRTSTNEGWTLDKTVIDSAWNWGNWSGWSRSNYTASETTTTKREVESKNVSDNNGYQVWVYYYWKDPSRLAFSYYNEGGNWQYYEFTKTSIDSHPAFRVIGSYNGQTKYYVGDYGCNFRSECWFLKNTYTVPATNHTEKRYRDGTKGYTYYWNKWDNWSEWNTTEVVESDTKKVETRDAYRYRASMEEIENNSGKSYEISGKVDESLAGKQATLLVYKNDEPSDSNNEYVGQVTIGEDGSYSFKFIPKQEISYKTGNYTVSLALEGAENPVFLETIVAPKPEYTVTFKDDAGNTIDTQVVKEGESATSPLVPDKEHYTFVGRDYGFTNVRHDMVVTAQYIKNKYSVAYVNWETKEVETNVFSYGDALDYPEETKIQGYDFVGWTTLDGEEVSEVTDNLVLQANYKIQTYTINFYDYNENLISSQNVTYGSDAKEPEHDEIDKMTFVGWSSYDFIQAKQSIDIYATYLWNETTETPKCNIKSGVFKDAQKITLTAEEGAEIFYTLDGSLPTRESNKYDGEFSVSTNTVLKFMAIAPEKNTSETQIVSMLIASGEDDEGALVVKKEKIDMLRGNTSKITYFLSHEDDNIGVNFYSLDENIATVDEKGNVTANNVGTTQIFVSTTDNKYADYCDINVTTDEVDAESIVLDKTSVVGLKDEKIQVNATVYPENTTDKEVDWYVEDGDIATVTDTGEVTLLKKGTTKLLAYSKTGTCLAECNVEALNEYKEDGLEITPKMCVLNVDENEWLWVTYGGASINVDYLSCDESVATVDKDGKITAVAPGVTAIRATTESGDEIYSSVVVQTVNKVYPTDKPAESSPTPAETTGPSVTALPIATAEQKNEALDARDTSISTVAEQSDSNKKIKVKKPDKVTGIKSYSISKNKLLLNWKKSEVSGYEVQYASNKKFTKKKITKRVTDNSITLKKLKRNKKYYVRIRAYNKSSQGRLYGKWSKAKKVRCK